MRKKRNQQLPLTEATVDHPKAKELAKINEILTANHNILELALQDLGTAVNNVGANGMTVEQVLRVALIKQIEGFSYRDLSFHLADSRAYSLFCRIGIGKSFKKSALQRGIKAISDKTWDLSVYNAATLAEHGLKAGIIKELNHYLPLARQVVCQTRRRVLQGESVPAQDKIVSIFEPHTDIIRKDRRDTYYGHKICVTGGSSNLILDCVILDGNPADSDLTGLMLQRQKSIYGRYPLKAAFDGGFSSQANLEKAKADGVKDVCFSKGRGLGEGDMCRSRRVYKGLRDFRAGIESGISWLKRSFGLGRCTWKGLGSFKSYVWASVVSANLLTIARTQLA
jgi:hypothetical protein